MFIRHDKRQTAKSLSLGVRLGWYVLPYYRVEDGFLRGSLETDKKARIYAPAAFPRLATDFARMENGDESAVLGFAQRWGHLGYEKLLRRPVSQPFVCEEPLSWIWAHANGVRVCMELLSRLEGQDQQQLAAFVKTLSAPAIRLGGAKVSPAVAYGCRQDVTTTSVIGSGSPERAAQKIVELIINENLSGLSPELKWQEAEGGFSEGTRFSALIEVIYWHLSRHALQMIGLSRCKGCEHFFPKTHGRQLFCPPENRETESRCGRRYRMWVQRMRERTKRSVKGR